MEEVTIYKFQLKKIQDALRMTSNVHKCSACKTCFDRNVNLAKKYAENALDGNKEYKVDYATGEVTKDLVKSTTN
jgi:hypothetical protein